MSRNAEKRQRWYDAGVAAFARFSGDEPPGYPCPLCLHAVPFRLTTFEHVPPRSVGGRAVALTCRKCNDAGSRLDAELRKAEDHREWARGTLGKPLRARVVFEGVPLNVDIERTPDQVTIVGLPKWNDPVNTEAHWAAWDRLAASGETFDTFTATFQSKYRERHARVALLRTAYLAAFALLGYRYVFRLELDVVRQQITDPDNEYIERFSLHRRQPLSQRVVVHATRPRNLECLFVALGDHAVFLPAGTPGLYASLAARTYWPLRARTMRAMQEGSRILGWPTRPHHTMDVPE